MNINKFFLNNFNIFKKTTPEELHITFLMNSEKYSQIYELIKNGYKLSEETQQKLINHCFTRIYNQTFDEEKSLYIFKIFNANESLKSNYLKEHTKRAPLATFFNKIMETISINETSVNKNTTALNIEFFNFFDSILKDPNRLPKGFSFPKEFIVLFLLENPIKEINGIKKIFNAGINFGSLPLHSTPFDQSSKTILNSTTTYRYFQELEYQIKQAEIQKLPFINTSSDDMQSKILKSIIKPQISEINQIQNFIDTTELTEDLKISLTMITATLNYLSKKELLPEELHNINTIKENLYQNLNDYDNVMQFLDKKDIHEYKNIYVNIATNLSKVLLNHEKSNLNELEQVQKVTKFRYK